MHDKLVGARLVEIMSVIIGHEHGISKNNDGGHDEADIDDNDTHLSLVDLGLQPMSIGNSRDLAAAKEDPFLHPCLRRIRRICGTMRHHLNSIICCCCCWTSDDDNDRRDPFHHSLTPKSTLLEHCHTLTRWSRTLYVGLFVVAVVTSFLSSSWGLIVFLSLQCVVILYYIYWRNHRLDFSLNQVIHYFAMGAALSIAWATIQSGLVGFLRHKKLFVASTTNGLWTYVWAFVLVGALEEYLKYQGFAMITQQQQRGASKLPRNWEDCEALLSSTTATTTTILPHSNSGAPSLVSSGAAITCAAIAVGAGFGWVENFVCIHGDAKSSFGSTSSTAHLAGKLTILPMHILLAAVQSIGLCSRHLEGNSTPLMLLPAVLLHGLFAYFLSKLAEREDEATLLDAGMNLVPVWMTVLVTLAYYVFFAGGQRVRLLAMDNTLEMLDTVDEPTADDARARTQSVGDDDAQNLDT